MNYNLKELANLLGGEIKGDSRSEVTGLAPFFQAKRDELTFAADEKFLKKLGETTAETVVVPPMPNLPEGKTYIVVESNPRELMPKLLAFFKRPVKPMEKLREDSAKIGANVSIAPNAYIGHDVELGDNVVIHPNVTIHEGVKIGEGSVIYSNAVIREFCILGKRCMVQPGAVIGSDGFGYTKVNGKNTKIDQIGRVVLGDEVEIGANTTIDRGAIGDTVIKSYTKVDNLVQIAHNDIIGENCIIISQVGIAGSTEVGDNTTLAGQVGVAGHIKIGSNVIVGAKSGIQGNVADNQILSGLPLVPVKEDMKIRASIKKLPELLKRVKQLEKLVK